MSCETDNVIYLIQCERCKKKYIGDIERKLKDRIWEHKGYIRSKKLNEPIGNHFNQHGHSIMDLKVII